MEPSIQKAFEFAQETTKQVLTLASGIIAITVTFLNGKLAAYPSSTKDWLEWGWACYVASILFGVITLLTLAGNLERPQKGEGNQSIYAVNITVPSALQLIAFFVATILTVIFGSKAA